MNVEIRQAAIIGGGVIGAGWVARFLLMGIDVNVFDPDPESERKIGEVLAHARRSVPSLYEHRMPEEGSLVFCETLREATVYADWITEAVPERLDLKQAVYKDIQAVCKASAIIASSTSGFRPTELHANSDNPEQIIVAHPFNPVYLIPLVELVGAITTIEVAIPILKRVGCFPLHVRKEIDAHIADRLLEAVWRESLWLINDGIATTEEVDDAIRYGFGLRWAQMGLFETYRIAGGEKGMSHFIKQFGPALNWPWSKLTDVPELTDELINKIASQSDQQSNVHSIRELENIRDDNLVSIMRGLKLNNWGAGKLLNQIDQALALNRKTDDLGLPITVERIVPNDWTDYNGHMNDSRYGDVFSVAADQMMTICGADKNYIATGNTYFTLDLQITYLVETHAGDAVFVRSKISRAEGKKLWLEHALYSAVNINERVQLATCKQLLIHVDLTTRRSSSPKPQILETINALQAQHAQYSL